MNRQRKVEKSSSKISNNSNKMQPHPPDEPPVNVSRRPNQLNQQINKENKSQNSELNAQSENIDENESIEENENIENNEEEENNDDINPSLANDKDSDDSWLDKLPPVIHPDEELHQELLRQRHQEHLSKVTSICHCELEAILNYSFECINRRVEEKEKNDQKGKIRKNKGKKELDKYEKAREIRVLRTKFRNGFMTPEIVIPQQDPELLSTLIEPFHTLSIQHYLHYQSTSYFSDLSCAFNISISEMHIEDPNPFFNDFIQKIFSSSEKFTQSFGTMGSLKFPFIVCVGGPNGGGRTTVTQFIQKVFDVHVIQLKQIVQASTKKQKKGEAPPATENSESNAPTEYLLKSATLIKYSDDKTAVQQIAQEIKSNMDGRGFIIDGFPNNKNQFASLEKELTAQSANMKDAQEELKDRTGSQRPPNPKAQFPCINGLIIALNNEENRERLIDPETGNVYKPGFNMPGLPDLIGVSPIEFRKVKNEIDDRLVTITVPEIKIIPAKQMQTYNQFEGVAKKTATCAIIKHCDRLKSFIESIDNFILSLFNKFPHLLPHQRDSNNIITQVFPPFNTLMKPSYLLLPHQCYSAIVTWYNCLNTFGRTIANQSNLAHTLDGKLDIMLKEATDRYQLFIGQKDERLSICDEFVKKNMDDTSGNYNLPQLFRTIWDISLKIRNKNLKHVDEVVGKSGLIELLLELRESPKLFFIALVRRMLYIKWFYETFQHLIYGKPPENKEDENKVDENKIITEEENVNEPQNPPENEQQKEQESEGESESEKSNGKNSKLSKSKGKDSKLSKSKGKDSKLSKSKGKDSKMSKSKGKDSKMSKAKGKDSKLSKSKGKSSKMSKSRKGSKMSKRNDESENDESSQMLDHKEEEEEPFIDKLINKDCEIPDFVLKIDPQLLQQQQQQMQLLKQQQEQENIESENQQQTEEINQSNIDISTVDENSPPTVPSINLLHFPLFAHTPHSARPIHPPDSVRRSEISNSNNSSNDFREALTQRDNRKVSFATDQMEDEYQSEAENRIKERKMMAKFHGFDYLLNQLHSFCESINPSTQPAAFDIYRACAELKIEPCEMKSSFDDIGNFAEEFFAYLASQFGDEDSLLSNEVQSNITIFRRFMNLCKAKEQSMVNSVFDLRDSLNHYTYAKCTHEMEHFAQQFRKLKQLLNSNQNVEPVKNIVAFSPKNTKKAISPLPKNSLTNTRSSPRSPRRTIVNNSNDLISPRNKRTKTIKNSTTANQTINSTTATKTTVNNAPKFSQSFAMLDSPLFEFDIKHVNNEIQQLAELELKLDTPIVAQDLVSSDLLIKIARYASQIHLFHASGRDMMQAVQDILFGFDEEEEEEEECDVNEEKLELKKLEFMKFQFCMCILECVERFDVLRFLLCFAHSRDEEIIIMNLFKGSSRHSNYVL